MNMLMSHKNKKTNQKTPIHLQKQTILAQTDSKADIEESEKNAANM